MAYLSLVKTLAGVIMILPVKCAPIGPTLACIIRVTCTLVLGRVKLWVWRLKLGLGGVWLGFGWKAWCWLGLMINVLIWFSILVPVIWGHLCSVCGINGLVVVYVTCILPVTTATKFDNHCNHSSNNKDSYWYDHPNYDIPFAASHVWCSIHITQCSWLKYYVRGYWYLWKKILYMTKVLKL